MQNRCSCGGDLTRVWGDYDLICKDCGARYDDGVGEIQISGFDRASCTFVEENLKALWNEKSQSIIITGNGEMPWRGCDQNCSRSIMKRADDPFCKYPDCKDAISCENTLPWREIAKGFVQYIIVKNGVSSISDYSFYDMWLRTVNMSEAHTLERIGKYAFANCRNLDMLRFPDNLRIIEDSAFIHCTQLKELVIPESVERIEHHAFAFCDKLTKVVISNPKTWVDGTAFFGCDHWQLKIVRE